METKRPQDPPKSAEFLPPEYRSIPREAPAFGQTGEPVKSSGRYLLRSQHVLAGDRLLEPGTEVGTDTEIPWPGPPTPNMEGLDDAGREEVVKLHKELYNRLPPWDYRTNAEYAIHEERRKEQENETDSVPVSHAQAVERGKEWKGPVPVIPTITRSISGDRTGGISLPAMAPPVVEQFPKD